MDKTSVVHEFYVINYNQLSQHYYVEKIVSNYINSDWIPRELNINSLIISLTNLSLDNLL
jgi:hypothetical protein